MAGPFQDKVDRARRQLHDYMHVDALYYSAPTVGEIPYIRQITCRVHDKFLRVGDLAGTNFHYAEMEENSPRGIFMRSEIEPKRGYIMATLRGYYRIDSMLPSDGITVTANLVRLTNQNDTEGLIPLDGTSYAYGQATLPGFV
jgi:hypothetical protein